MKVSTAQAGRAGPSRGKRRLLAQCPPAQADGPDVPAPTVRNHASTIIGKAQASGRGEAVVRARDGVSAADLPLWLRGFTTGRYLRRGRQGCASRRLRQLGLLGSMSPLTLSRP